MNANTSVTPLALGTAGTIFFTPDPFPGFDQSTVPIARASADTVTSAVAVPAVIVTWPAATAVSTGGSSLDRLTTVVSLDVHVSPVTGWLDAFNAWSVRVSPTSMLSRFGASVNVLPPVTLNVIELLHTPFCWIRAGPVAAPAATVASTSMSLQ